MCWIAFPRGKNKVASGTFATTDVRAYHNPRPRNSGRVNFQQGSFSKPPTVLVALNMLDMAGNADLRVKVYVTDVDKDGFSMFSFVDVKGGFFANSLHSMASRYMGRLDNVSSSCKLDCLGFCMKDAGKPTLHSHET